jgi:hypothetical protein
MIDIESEIFTAIASAVRNKYPGAYVVGEYVKSPSKFPCVSVVEIDNSVYDNTQTSGSLENHANMTYEVNIYSNKTSGKKSECKAIASLIDNEFAALGMSRTMLQPILNMDDITVYRMTGRYMGVVSINKQIYRR